MASTLADPGLYANWAVQPLAASWHPARYARCELAATLLSNDQACVAPCRAMQVGNCCHFVCQTQRA